MSREPHMLIPLCSLRTAMSSPRRLLPLLQSLLVLQVHLSNQLEDNKIPPSLCTGQPGIPGSPGLHGSPGQPGRDGRDGRDAPMGEKGEKGDRGDSGDVSIHECVCVIGVAAEAHVSVSFQARRDWGAWRGTEATQGRKVSGVRQESARSRPNLPSAPRFPRAALCPSAWTTRSNSTRSYWTSRTTTARRRAASPAKSPEFTSSPSTPRSTAPACSSTWWKTPTRWPPTSSSTATGPNRCPCLAARCSTSSPATRCGFRCLCPSTMDFTPAPRQTAPSADSWCTRTGKTLLCLRDVKCKTCFYSERVRFKGSGVDICV